MKSEVLAQMSALAKELKDLAESTQQSQLRLVPCLDSVLFILMRMPRKHADIVTLSYKHISQMRAELEEVIPGADYRMTFGPTDPTFAIEARLIPTLVESLRAIEHATEGLTTQH